jgi:DNA-binding NarL/FixJ family response regulator
MKSCCIVEDENLFSELLADFLERSMEFKVAGKFFDGLSAWRFLENHRVDLVVLDLRLPQMNGSDLFHRIKKLSHPPAVLFLSATDDHLQVRNLLASGARGFIRKNTSLQEILTAARRVADGGVFLDVPGAEIGDVLLRPGQQKETDLTPREREVLHLIAEGKRTKEVAELLFLSPRTVEKYREKLKQKLAVRDTAGMVRYALKEGFMPHSDPRVNKESTE